MSNPNVRVTNLYLRPTPEAELEALTVADTAVQLASADWQGPTQYVEVSIEGADVRVTFDGSDPTSAVGDGVTYAQGIKDIWTRAKAAAAKFIAADGTGPATVIAHEMTGGT